MADPEPAYLALHRSDELLARAEAAQALLTKPCRVCPKLCPVDRITGTFGRCRIGRQAVVSSYGPHHGEEDCLRGWSGSGTIFFAGCNLRCVFCLSPNTRVFTDRGVLRIEDIFHSAPGPEAALDGGAVRFVEGIRIFTGGGKLAPVAKAFRHPYGGEMVTIKPYGLPPIVATPEHSIFAARAPGAEIQKIPAGVLSRGHLLVVPKLCVTGVPTELDVPTLLGPYVGLFRKAVPRRVPAELFGQVVGAAECSPKSSQDLGRQLGYHAAYVRRLRGKLRRGQLEPDSDCARNDLVEQTGRVRFKTEKGPGVPVRLRLDEDLACLLGYYCAEGHVTSQKRRPNSHRVVFSFGRKGEALADHTRTLIQRVLARESTLRVNRTTLTVEVGSSSVALVFKALCGANSHGKRIPTAIFAASPEIARAFLASYLRGDGCSQPAYLAMNTVSEELALDLVALLLRIGIFPYFYATSRPASQTIEGRSVKQSATLYYVKCRRDAWEGHPAATRLRCYETDDAFWVPIREITRVQYEGPVYNLEVVNDDHSYIANGIAVGNCQNYDISCQVEGEPATASQIARMMVSLQAQGCHNINWVTPEHVVPQILEALPLAVEAGLRLPIVYNTSAYDALESLHLLDGVVDVYMPDFKLWTPERARRYMLTPDYPEVARAALREMHRQVGDLLIDERGIALRGVLVRHLVMPGLLDETAAILHFLVEELGTDTYVNLMPQYVPAGRVGKHYPEINRRLSGAEFAEVLAIADRLGLRRLDRRAE